MPTDNSTSLRPLPQGPVPAVCLRALFDYDEETGVLTWRERPFYHFATLRACRVWNTKHAGKVAGGDNGQGYLIVKIEGKMHRVHRIIWAMQTGAWPADQIDHKNHRRADNRWINLREATNPINSKNQSMPSTNTSGHLGVYRRKASCKWMAYIHVDGTKKHIGYFTEFEDAAAARRAAEVLYGYHRNHGA